MEKSYKILLTPEAERMIQSLDGAQRKIITKAVRRLKESPEVGKPLVDELIGFHSYKTGRFRIVYKIFEKNIAIVIVGAGIRKEGDKKDIYLLLKKLAKTGLLEDVKRYLEK